MMIHLHLGSSIAAKHGHYYNCQLVTSKGHDLELPASYHRGAAMIDRAGREEAAEGLWRECG